MLADVFQTRRCACMVSRGRSSLPSSPHSSENYLYVARHDTAAELAKWLEAKAELGLLTMDAPRSAANMLIDMVVAEPLRLAALEAPCLTRRTRDRASCRAGRGRILAWGQRNQAGRRCWFGIAVRGTGNQLVSSAFAFTKGLFDFERKPIGIVIDDDINSGSAPPW